MHKVKNRIISFMLTIVTVVSIFYPLNIDAALVGKDNGYMSCTALASGVGVNAVPSFRIANKGTWYLTILTQFL